MIGDPFVLVICDGCEEEYEAELTPLASNCFDMRGVEGQLKRADWTTHGNKHFCLDCVEVTASEADS